MATTGVNEPSVDTRQNAASPSRARRWLVGYPRAVPLAIFVAIATITVLGVFAIETNARSREAAQVREYAQGIASSLERRSNNFASYLRAGAALLSTTRTTEPETFNQFVSELRLDLEYRGVEGIGWISIVEQSERAAFLSAQRVFQPAFPELRPAVRQEDAKLAPVTYFYPSTERNRRALGFDMYSEPKRAAAMNEAARIVQPTASAKIVLAQEGLGTAPGFVMFMPVFRQIEGARQVDRELAGFVYSPFNADRFLESAMESAAPKALGVRLYDGEAQTDNLLVAHSVVEGGGVKITQTVSVANHQLQLVVEAPKGSSLAFLSMVTLLFGLAVASLLMLLARLLTQQAFEDQARLAFFEEQHSIRNSLTRELNHRVKNTLANVLSILALTRRRASNLDDFADSLEGRIRALTATHDLLTGTDWGTTPIRSVVEAELQHFRAMGDNVVNIDGPPVELAPNDALSFGLAIHELATNAAKYGALSVPEGRVSIYWRLVEGDCAEVDWCEREGPEVHSERERGFGMDLIEKIVAHELRNPVRLTFEREGVRCVMRVPVRQRRDFQIREDG